MGAGLTETVPVETWSLMPTAHRLIPGLSSVSINAFQPHNLQLFLFAFFLFCNPKFLSFGGGRIKVPPVEPHYYVIGRVDARVKEERDGGESVTTGGR